MFIYLTKLHINNDVHFNQHNMYIHKLWLS